MIAILRLLVDSEVRNSSKSENQLLNKPEKVTYYLNNPSLRWKKKSAVKRKSDKFLHFSQSLISKS